MEFRKVSRDKRQILSKERSEEILAKASHGVLAVLGDGDYPYGVPVSFAYKDNTIYFHGMPSGHKFDAMKNHEKVCFTVVETDNVVPEEYTTYFRSVIVFGRARIIEDLEEKHKIVDYLVEKYSPGLEEGVHELFAKRIAWMGAFEIDVDHISGKEAIELAEPGWQLDELKDK
ncbi:MAG: pyridoxamine 5'-phosphate oxidase family protein [Firmicutes bacterium]|nr:pyridoxamine 5'-phosphate oxidase family protein [Bacillota bacterium]